MSLTFEPLNLSVRPSSVAPVDHTQSPLETLAHSELILEQEPDNAAALYMRARSLDVLADREKSNGRLEQAIFAYRAILDLESSVDDHLYRVAALRCIDRMRFRGKHLGLFTKRQRNGMKLTCSFDSIVM